MARVEKTYGLPTELARLVVDKVIDLNSAIARLAERDEVVRLVRDHGLDRAIATQVARGQVKLDDVLQRMRVQAHLAAHRDDEAFFTAQAEGRTMALAVHGHRILVGGIVAVRPYEIDVNVEDGAVTTLHKTQVKYLLAADDVKKLKKALTIDNARRDRVAEPRLRPQDRFPCSNRRLGDAWATGREVAATTLEGDRITGRVARVSRYEFLLHTRQGVDVVMLRHALDDFRDAG